MRKGRRNAKNANCVSWPKHGIANYLGTARPLGNPPQRTISAWNGPEQEPRFRVAQIPFTYSEDLQEV
ncbi:MAG TPA: hypothetical protein PK819_13590, partial [Thermomicrobiales bacterium]|nr:hypothetical protein [Thermomicrobiales bacterium]